MTEINGQRGLSTSLTLLQQLDKNDAGAWQQLCRVYTPFVWTWAGQMGFGSSDREDVVQEVFVRVHHSLAKFTRQKEGSFRSWLKTITRNFVRDQFRRADDFPKGTGGTDAMSLWQELPNDTPDIEESEDEEVGRQALRHIDLGLSPLHQDVVKHVVSGRKMRDVADDLGLSYGNVMQIWSRAKRNARGYLDGL